MRDCAEAGDRLAADPLGRAVRRQQLRVPGFDRPQLFEHRVADIHPPLAGLSAERPLNNASLLAQRVYGMGLGRFDGLLERRGGDLRAMIGSIKRLTASGGDPWLALGRAYRYQRRMAHIMVEVGRPGQEWGGE